MSTLDILFHQAATRPLADLPPPEYLLTRLPESYPLIPVASPQPPNAHQPRALSFFYREQKTYTPTAYNTKRRYRSPSSAGTPPPLSPALQELSSLHLNSFRKEDAALFDFLVLTLPPAIIDDYIDVWANFFKREPEISAAEYFEPALLFILKLRHAANKPLVNVEKDYAAYLQTTFAPLTAQSCHLSWDRHSDIRVWTVTLSNTQTIQVYPNPRVPLSIQLHLPHLFQCDPRTICKTLLDPVPADIRLDLARHLAQTNGFTTY